MVCYYCCLLYTSVVAIAVVTLNTTTPPSSSSHALSVSTITVSTLVSSPPIRVVIGVYIVCSSILRRMVIPALVWWSIGVVIKIGSPVIVVILVAAITTVIIITRVIRPVIIVRVINVIIILVYLAIIIKISSRISRVIIIIINVRLAAHGIKVVISSTTPTIISLVLLIF